MLRRMFLAFAATMALVAPARAQDRLECVLTGDDYPYREYPEGSPTV